MIELAFVVCLRLMPDRCEDRSILYLPEITLMGCMMQAQPQLAAWCEAHPDLQVARWSCRLTQDGALKA
jgi:hypothetical protein